MAEPLRRESLTETRTGEARLAGRAGTRTSPAIARLLPLAPHTFMLVVGVIEMVAGILVAIKPSVGAYVVAAWLWAIIVNLLLIPGYFDVALRDLGLSLGALALAMLAAQFEER